MRAQDTPLLEETTEKYQNALGQSRIFSKQSNKSLNEEGAGSGESKSSISLKKKSTHQLNSVTSLRFRLQNSGYLLGNPSHMGFKDMGRKIRSSLIRPCLAGVDRTVISPDRAFSALKGSFGWLWIRFLE
ncbi:hypothetical protein NPIL_149901 [Nephila pilipes]|uniref:Uncharacterized protein n=1 Tax=Nephila pilipes TaxID=299642 RepID=A0A8X6TBQ1_NEPPI|nr:hypothetical protein NPIL_149901 [Nephila pilipes]